MIFYVYGADSYRSADALISHTARILAPSFCLPPTPTAIFGLNESATFVIYRYFPFGGARWRLRGQWNGPPRTANENLLSCDGPNNCGAHTSRDGLQSKTVLSRRPAVNKSPPKSLGFRCRWHPGASGDPEHLSSA